MCRLGFAATAADSAARCNCRNSSLVPNTKSKEFTQSLRLHAYMLSQYHPKTRPDKTSWQSGMLLQHSPLMGLDVSNSAAMPRSISFTLSLLGSALAVTGSLANMMFSGCSTKPLVFVSTGSTQQSRCRVGQQADLQVAVHYIVLV